jgi:4-hydroxy-4-methyl-2-oxoglutarate aldolase
MSGNESALFDRMERTLYSSVISDALDEIGIRNHTLNRLIRPLSSDAVIAGRAMTVMFSEKYVVVGEPYRKTIEALDGIKPDQVPVIATNNNTSTAVWGELLSTASRARGARGTIVDGMSRDAKKILEMKFKVFCTGMMPTDSKGRAEVVNYNHPIGSGDALIEPDDIVFGDIDGVVSIPKSAERDIIRLAFEKASRENLVRDDLLKGSLLKEAWAKHKTL